MTYKPEITVVPRDLYYVERDLVERQAAEILRLRTALHDLLSVVDELIPESLSYIKQAREPPI